MHKQNSIWCLFVFAEHSESELGPAMTRAPTTVLAVQS